MDVAVEYLRKCFFNNPKFEKDMKKSAKLTIIVNDEFVYLLFKKTVIVRTAAEEMKKIKVDFCSKNNSRLLANIKRNALPERNEIINVVFEAEKATIYTSMMKLWIANNDVVKIFENINI